jgi:hypothetical protein
MYQAGTLASRLSESNQAPRCGSTTPETGINEGDLILLLGLRAEVNVRTRAADERAMATTRVRRHLGSPGWSVRLSGWEGRFRGF